MGFIKLFPIIQAIQFIKQSPINRARSIAEGLRGRFLPLAPYHWPWRRLNADSWKSPVAHSIHGCVVCFPLKVSTFGYSTVLDEPNISVTSSGFVFGFFQRSQNWEGGFAMILVHCWTGIKCQKKQTAEIMQGLGHRSRPRNRSSYWGSPMLANPKHPW